MRPVAQAVLSPAERRPTERLAPLGRSGRAKSNPGSSVSLVRHSASPRRMPLSPPQERSATTASAQTSEKPLRTRSCASLRLENLAERQAGSLHGQVSESKLAAAVQAMGFAAIPEGSSGHRLRDADKLSGNTLHGTRAP